MAFSTGPYTSKTFFNCSSVASYGKFLINKTLVGA